MFMKLKVRVKAAITMKWINLILNTVQGSLHGSLSGRSA